MTDTLYDSPKPRPYRKFLTVREAALEIGIHYTNLYRWIKLGHVPVILTPGRTLEDGKQGRKGIRIKRTEWVRWKKEHGMGRGRGAGMGADK